MLQNLVSCNHCDFDIYHLPEPSLGPPYGGKGICPIVVAQGAQDLKSKFNSAYVGCAQQTSLIHGGHTSPGCKESSMTTLVLDIP